MAALTKFTENAILDAAESVIAESGIEGASIASIARRCGAPNGSIYHRFASKQHLIGALWVRIATSYRTTLTDALGASPSDLAEEVVNLTFDWVAANPSRAELLMRLRTEDFVLSDWPEVVVDQIQATNAALGTELLELAQSLSLHPLDVTLAVIDVPAAAARRCLLLADPAATHHIRERAIQLVRTLLEQTSPATQK